MSYPSDDLATVLLAPNREFAGYGQGVLLQFDSATFSNAVDYRGTVLTDLPVMSGADALTYQPGDVVLLMKWKPSGRGMGSYWIAGRPVVPASGNAEAAIGFLTTTLGSAVAKSVIANTIFVNDVGAVESTTSSTYTDLSTPGPTVSDVTITSTGNALVLVSANILLNNINAPSEANFNSGWASFTVSGATTVAASDANAVSRHIQLSTHNGANSHIINESVQTTKAIFLEGLNEGTHSFQMKYRRNSGGTEPVPFGVRTLVVVGF